MSENIFSLRKLLLKWNESLGFIAFVLLFFVNLSKPLFWTKVYLFGKKGFLLIIFFFFFFDYFLIYFSFIRKFSISYRHPPVD